MHLNSIDDDIKWTTGSVKSPDTVSNVEVNISTRTERALAFLDNSSHPLEHKRGLVKTLMHRMDTVLRDERDKVKEKSLVKHALKMNGYPDWLINSIPLPQPSLESTTSVLINDTSDDGQDTAERNNN